MTITNPVQPPHACIQCGTVLGTSGGRCPQCGAVQPEAPPAPQNFQPPPYVPSARPAPAKKRSAAPTIAVVAAIGVVVCVGVVAAVMMGSKDDVDRGPAAPSAPAATASAPAKPVDPDDMGVADLSAVRVGDIVPRALTRALVWDKNAQMVSIDASPVVDGKVNSKDGGKVEVLFAKPAGARLGPGSKVGTARLSVVVDAGGSKVTEATGEPGARAVEEPVCGLGEAWRKMVASGVPSNSKAAMRYAHSDKYARAVWTSSVGDEATLSRTIDGRTCSIVVR